jgi:GTP-binding protein
MSRGAPRVREAEMLVAADSPARFPRPSSPELALLGRSNVGKSSLLNRLAGRRALARTSATPGKTRRIHWYRVARPRGDTFVVDLPGYGWARVSKAERRRWRALVEAYLDGRPTLRAAALLQDVRRDLGDDELSLLAWLAERGVAALLVLTKVDKLSRMQRAQRLRALGEASGLPAARVVATSAQTGEGVAELWRAFDALEGEG